MARTVKVTYTLDDATIQRVERAAARLGIPKSGVVREAVAEYAARSDKLNVGERTRMLAALDALVARKPTRSPRAVDAELAGIRRARRHGGRRTPADASDAPK